MTLLRARSVWTPYIRYSTFFPINWKYRIFPLCTISLYPVDTLKGGGMTLRVKFLVFSFVVFTGFFFLPMIFPFDNPTHPQYALVQLRSVPKSTRGSMYRSTYAPIWREEEALLTSISLAKKEHVSTRDGSGLGVRQWTFAVQHFLFLTQRMSTI